MRDGKQVRTTIGRYPAITLRDARIKASELKAGPAQSNDADDEPTPVQLLDEWFEKYVMRECRESTQKNYRYTFSSVKNRLPDRPLNQITMDMCVTSHRRVICHLLVRSYGPSMVSPTLARRNCQFVMIPAVSQAHKL